MIEETLKPKLRVESKIKKEKQIEYILVSNIKPYKGHILWEINRKTKEINKAQMSKKTFTFNEENRPEIIQRDGYDYVSALNKKNALKSFRKGKQGGKPKVSNPMYLCNTAYNRW